MNNIKMLYYDVYEGINVNKTSESKEWDSRHYWYFLNKVFRFQSYVCSEYHGFINGVYKSWMMSVLNIKGFTQQNWGHKPNPKFWFDWRKAEHYKT